MNGNDLLMAILGGALIGLSSSALLYSVGRVAGISGIVGGLLKPTPGDSAWRVVFVAGLLVGGLVLAAFMPEAINAPTGRSLTAVASAGLLVGFGVRMGNGCTSGHGVCGLSRRSRRSLAATLMFMATGALTATAIQLFSGGVL
jgi:uncharacterized membrane protein YedE/YeeE